MTASAGKTLHNSKHQFFQRTKPLWNAGCYLFKNSYLRTFLFLIGVKKILQEVIFPKNVLHCFSTEKIICLVGLWGKKIFPLRNFPTTISPQMSNGSPLSPIWDLHFFNRKKKRHKIWSSYQLPTVRGGYPFLEKTLMFFGPVCF